VRCFSNLKTFFFHNLNKQALEDEILGGKLHSGLTSIIAIYQRTRLPF